MNNVKPMQCPLRTAVVWHPRKVASTEILEAHSKQIYETRRKEGKRYQGEKKFQDKISETTKNSKPRAVKKG